MGALRALAVRKERKLMRLKTLKRVQADVRGVGVDGIRLLLPYRSKGGQAGPPRGYVNARRRWFLQSVAHAYAGVFHVHDEQPAENLWPVTKDDELIVEEHDPCDEGLLVEENELIVGR